MTLYLNGIYSNDDDKIFYSVIFGFKRYYKYLNYNILFIILVCRSNIIYNKILFHSIFITF